MKANKIFLENEVLLDLTQDTAIEEDVLAGKTFHKADGSPAVGTAVLGGGEREPVIEPITITENGMYPVPKGLVEGGTYTLKNNLNDINPADFMKSPLIEGAYTIFRYDPSISAGLGFVTAELLASFGANVTSDGWMVTTPDIENIYYYPLKVVDDVSGEMVDNYVGWLTIPGNNVAPEISITIPSPFDA